MKPATHRALLDPERLAALRRTGMLDTAAEPNFDRLAGLAARLVGAPTALVILIDADRQVTKGTFGLAEHRANDGETAISRSLCHRIVESAEPLKIEDARLDPVLRDDLSVRDIGVVAYLGLPLVTGGGHVLGTVCVIDSVPRTWTPQQVSDLESVAAAARAEIEMRSALRVAEERSRDAEAARQEQRESAEQANRVLESLVEGVFTVDAQFRFTYVNAVAASHLKRTREELLGQVVWEVFPGSVGSVFHREYSRALREQVMVRFEALSAMRPGVWFEILASPNGGGLIISSRDVSERKHAEAASRAAQVETLRIAGRMQAITLAASELLGARSAEQLQDVLRTVLGTVLSFDAFVLSLHEPETGILHFLANFDDGIIGPPDSYPIAGTPNEQVVRDRRSLLTLSSDDPAGRGSHLFGTGRRSESAIRTPIVSDGAVLGILSVQSYTPGLYSAEDVQVVETVAALAATTLLNLRFLDEREAAERSLRISQRRLEHLLAASPSVIYSCRVDSTGLRPTFVSDNVAALLGFSAREVLQTPDFWTSRLHPDDLPRAVEELPRALHQIRHTHEYRVLHADGGYRWICDEMCVVRDPDGHAMEIVGTLTDHTSRKEAEHALRRSEEHFRQFFEDDISGDYIASADGTIVECNRAFACIFGFRSPTDVVGHNVKEFHTEPADRDALVERVRAGQKLQGLELRLKRREGATVHVISNVVGVFDESGELLQTRGYVIDVTERMSIEEQLRQSQKMEAVGRLAGGIAHDFNNLLTAILGNARLVAEELEPGTPLRSDVEEIHEAAERAATLTRQLLTFSRRQMIRPQILNPIELVLRSERMLRRLIGADVELVTELAPDTGHILGDVGQFEQVVLNLVVNARDAMPGGGRIRIRTSNARLTDRDRRRYRYVVPGDYVLMEVVDTGCGMDADTLEHIFEPFFTTKEVGRGTGLGLSTVYGIVKQNGGYIWAASEVGRGTRFQIYLPRQNATAEQPDEAAPKPEPVAASETVLLVEDEPAVRSLACRVLQRHGYRVLEAVNGVDALRVLDEHAGPVDLLLTDVVMPAMGGPELARQLLSARPSTRVLFMSGYAEDHIVHEGVVEADTEFLEKPFTPGGLAEKVRAVLDGASPGSRATPA